jgi:tetratricopeptide (TPR) repeat protein
MEKNLQLDKNIERYVKIADKKVGEDDLLGAFYTLKSVEKFTKSTDIIVRLADLYADMGLLEISNRYWYKYMSIAPKEKVPMAYEELGINFFYMENLWATGYYFHKKIETDGVISKDSIDNEIIEFLSGDEFKKYAYRIVYPPEKADFSLESKSGKRALALGAFNEAVLMLEKIPLASRTEENSDDLTMAYIMSDDLENAQKESRRALKEYGDSVGVYCNLSTIYGLKKDKEKSEYYYQKALSLTKGERTEAYKLMSCAIEMEDHLKVKECLDKVIEERPYEISMLFFQGIAYLNLSKFSLAVESLKKAHSLDTENLIVEYFYNLAKQFENGEGEDKLLPLKYEKCIPKKVESRWSAKIRYLINNPQKFNINAKKQENIKLFKWALLYASDSLMRSLSYSLATLNPKLFYKLAQEVLMLPEAGEAQKRLMVYMLAMSGYKGKISIVFGIFFKEYNAKKLACEKDFDHPLFLTAYSLAMSKLVFSDVENLDKIAENADKIYIALKDKLDEGVHVEEICALIILECKFNNHTDINKICAQLHCDVEKVNYLRKIYYKG